MPAISHKLFRKNKNLRLFMLLRLFLPGVFICSIQVPCTFADTASYSTILERNKWYWQPFLDDLESVIPKLPFTQSSEVSLDYCWSCGLWLEDSFSPTQKSTTNERQLVFQKAQCLQALGMEKEAIELYRRIIRQNPQGSILSRTIQSILKILSQQKNHKAVIKLYDEFRSEYRQQLLPESIYLISQSLYSLENNDLAQKLLKQIPRNSSIYPYALYMQAQIAFRKGNIAWTIETITGLIDAPTNITPKILKEMAWLMRGRIFFQQKAYQKAILDFRKLDRSDYFLPEALMGMGWCFSALGEHSKAIAYFQTVRESPADADTLAKAQLEIAHSFSEAQSHQDAFKIFRSILNHLHLRISQYKKYGQDPEWLNWLAKQLLTETSNNDFSLGQAPLMSQDKDLQKEIIFLIKKEQYSSSRMKTVFEIQKGLKEVNALFEKPIEKESDIKEDDSIPFQYPPLKTALALLPADLRHLLDIYFALLDTEYRLIHSGCLLGLLNPDEKPALLRDSLDFYQSAFQSLLFPEQARKKAYTTLAQMQSTIRNLPVFPEERETIATKILYTKRILYESDQTIHDWTAEMNGFCFSPKQPIRMLLLNKWMTFVRVLVDLRTWNIRSQAIFLNKSIPLSLKEISPIALPTETNDKMTERIGLIKDRLALVLQREIQIIHQNRLGMLEDLLIKAQYYYANALIRQQQNLIQTQQTPPASIQQEEQP